MTQNEEKIKYFLYARKSSESEDRQIQSIEDQVNRLKKLASDLNLDIKKTYTESKSAKEPNNRPLFNEMLERIENGEARGILCWQINRLSRNPVDGGKIGWLLQKNILKSIQTMDRQYLPEDNVLLLSVETGVANQFLLDLSKNVKRGIQSKLEKGWRAGMASVGYLNDVYNHTIIKDPERFNLIRKCWDYMLTGNYTVSQILDKLNNDWGFLSHKRKRSGGKTLTLSALYGVFTNLFYTGIIVHNGQQYEGKHDPMITLEEFDRVQIILGRAGKPRPKKHFHAFTGAIRCGECGCFYTAETKRKNIKSSGRVKEYTYYHCTRRSRKIHCTQRKVITESNLEELIEKEIEKYTILPQFLEWALDGLNKKNDKEIEDRSKIYEMQNKQLIETQKQLDELIKMRFKDFIDDDTYLREKKDLQDKLLRTRDNIKSTETRADKWLELTEKTFNFATYARTKFITAKGKEGLELKKEILMTLGKIPIIKGSILTIESNEWLVPIKNNYPKLEEEYLGLELDKIPLNKVKTELLDSVITRWQGV